MNLVFEHSFLKLLAASKDINGNNIILFQDMSYILQILLITPHRKRSFKKQRQDIVFWTIKYIIRVFVISFYTMKRLHSHQMSGNLNNPFSRLINNTAFWRCWYLSTHFLYDVLRQGGQIVREYKKIEGCDSAFGVIYATSKYL